MNATTIIILAYVGFNGLLLGAMAYKRIMTDRTKDWPSTLGRVKSARVSFSSSTEKTGGVPYVLYTYEVGGKKYESSVIEPGDLTIAGNDHAEAVVARYPAGASVTVYYNPRDPKDAFLEKYAARTSGDWSLLIGGNILITIGAAVYLLVAQFMK